jgi:Flp pilus assembly protein TadD
MYRFIAIIIFSLAAVLQFGCSTNGSTAGNAVAPTPYISTPSKQASAAAPEASPVVYTDAKTALAEGSKYLDTSDNEKAIDAFRQAVTLDPTLAEAHFKLGVALALTEDHVQMKLDKDSKPGKKGVAAKPIQTASEKAFAEAAKSYEKLVAQNPKDDGAFYNLGRAYGKLLRDKEAESAFRKAVRLKPNDSDYNTELGVILIKLAKYQDAISFLKKAISLDENNSYAADQLEKAQAGSQRVNYRAAPKTSIGNQSERSKPSSPREDTGPLPEPSPVGQ